MPIRFFFKFKRKNNTQQGGLTLSERLSGKIVYEEINCLFSCYIFHLNKSTDNWCFYLVPEIQPAFVRFDP